MTLITPDSPWRKNRRTDAERFRGPCLSVDLQLRKGLVGRDRTCPIAVRHICIFSARAAFKSLKNVRFVAVPGLLGPARRAVSPDPRPFLVR